MKQIITIGRQYGAAGGEVGKKVANALGIAYYDRDLILKTASASLNITPDQVRKWDEKVPIDVGFAQSLFHFYNKPFGEELWQAQVDAIRTLANRENCVIVGRNADWILKEYDHCLKVFIHADKPWRIRHMKTLHPETTEEQIKADLKAADKARKYYCSHYTGQVYGLAQNYDLTLSTSMLGIDHVADIIVEAAKHI